jgi:hypothetical protein
MSSTVSALELSLALEYDLLQDRLHLSLYLELNLVVTMNLSSYGKTANEITVSKISVSVACALSRKCASTNRLPKKFHIGCPGERYLRNMAFDTRHNIYSSQPIRSKAMKKI